MLNPATASIKCRCGLDMLQRPEAGGMACLEWTPESERQGLHAAIRMSGGASVTIDGGAIRMQGGPG